MNVINLKEKPMTTNTRARLSHAQYLKLALKMQTDYKECGLPNDAYALKATADLAFPVGVSSIEDVLKELGMDPNVKTIQRRKGTAINLTAEARLKIELMWETLGNMNPDMLRRFNEQDR